MGLQNTVNVVIWMFFAIALIFMVTRTYAIHLSGKLRTDLFLAWFAFLVGIAANIMCSISVHWGAGLHQDTLPDHHAVEAVKWQWFMFQTYVVAVMIAKLAIIAFLLEFEANISSKRRWLLYAVGVINVAVNLGTSSLQWQQCDNVRATWDFTLPKSESVCNGRVRNTQGGYVQGSFSAAIDVFLAMYPAIVFWHLKMDNKVRTGLCALFSCGFISCALAILKTVGISKLAATDTTYDLAILDIYSLVELWVALIVGSVPPSKPVWNKFIRNRNRVTTLKNNSHGYIEQSDQSKARQTVYKNQDRYNVGVTAKDQFGSEESILANDGHSGGILMVKTVHIANDEV